MRALRLVSCCMAAAAAAGWLSVSVTDYGAVGDNATDSSAAFRAALAAVTAAGGGEVLVPAPGIFKTLPVNLSSHMRLRVDGTMFALATNVCAWPLVPPIFTYATTMPTWRYQPFVWYPGVEAGINISVAGTGESECSALARGGGLRRERLCFTRSPPPHHLIAPQSTARGRYGGSPTASPTTMRTARTSCPCKMSPMWKFRA